jgi:predicted ATPase/DNA-binding winged helix-turn-helix (wHTH) protein
MLRFGRFELDHQNRQLRCDGRVLSLEQRAFDLLWYLANRSGQLVRKDELLEQVWQAQFLTDGALSNSVAKLRKVLGQRAREREPIETVYGIGYRFHGHVETVARAESPSEAAPAPPPMATVLAPLPDPFVGRSAAMGLLAGCLERAHAGRGQLAVIIGEAGIGKSRTLSEFATHAKARGFSAWQGSAYAGDSAPAYWPWVEIVRAAQTDLGGDWHSQLLADSWALGHWLAEPLHAPLRVHDAPALRFRLFDELARLFTLACRRAPRLIVLEDLHLADAGTLDLLAHLVRALAAQPILFAASLRERELARDDAFARALARCLQLATHVPLQGLTRHDVGELVEGLGAVASDEGFCEVLSERTQGNPFFIRQLLQLLQRQRQPAPLQSRQLVAAEVPPAVRGVIGQRLLQLPSDARSLLTAASVAGESFDAAMLVELSGFELDRVLAGLEPALQMGLIAARAEAPQRFSFSHALLRDALSDELSLLERGRLHGLLAGCLAHRQTEGHPTLLAEIARHSVLAAPADLQACVEHCLRAAEAAQRASGFEAAAAIVQRALDKLEAEGGSAELRCRLLLQLGISQICSGEVAAALLSYERGARLARELAAPELLARFVGRLADWLDIGGNRSDVGTLLADALERVEGAAAAPRANLLAQHAMIGEGLTPDRRAQLFTEAEQLAQASGDPETMLEVTMARINARDVFHREESRRAIASYRALALRHRHATDGGQYQLRSFSAALTSYLCALIEADPESIQHATRHIRVVAEESHVQGLHQVLEVLSAGRALAEGRLDDLSQAVQRLRARSDLPGGLGLVWSWYALQLAAARSDQQSFEQLLELGELSVLERIAPRQRNASMIGVARVFAKLGQHALARQLMSDLGLARAELERLPEQYGDLGLLCSLVELRWELSDSSDLELLDARLSPHAKLNAVGIAFDYSGSVAHYLGILSLMQGRPGQAIQRLRLAREQNRRLDMPNQLAWTEALLERALSAAAAERE